MPTLPPLHPVSLSPCASPSSTPLPEWHDHRPVRRPLKRRRLSLSLSSSSPSPSPSASPSRTCSLSRSPSPPPALPLNATELSYLTRLLPLFPPSSPSNVEKLVSLLGCLLPNRQSALDQAYLTSIVAACTLIGGIVTLPPGLRTDDRQPLTPAGAKVYTRKRKRELGLTVDAIRLPEFWRKKRDNTPAKTSEARASEREEAEVVASEAPEGRSEVEVQAQSEQATGAHDDKDGPKSHTPPEPVQRDAKARPLPPRPQLPSDKPATPPSAPTLRHRFERWFRSRRAYVESLLSTTTISSSSSSPSPSLSTSSHSSPQPTQPDAEHPDAAVRTRPARHSALLARRRVQQAYAAPFDSDRRLGRRSARSKTS